ncbi:hypothetical protein ACRXCV_05730 [Halobacteriovorax sp. GFR7]|uniref:hypothetical protein n=1 Tax=unclassified Halobacteriovorax TaxID=2639665 RepID=UPI003D99687D
MIANAAQFEDLTAIDYELYKNIAITKEFVLDDGKKIMNREVFADDAKIYAVKDNSYLQSFLDKAVANIFLNEAGKDFCLMFKDNAQAIRSATAVSIKMSEYLAKKCHSMIIKVYGKNFFDELSIQVKPFKREFYFVIGENKRKPLKSWSSMTNDTFLIIEGVEPVIEIYKRIIHELYITYDHKSVLGRGQYNLIRDKDYKIKNGKMFSIGAKDDLDKVLGIIPYPLIRFNFSITRALAFENIILNSMFKMRRETLPYEFINDLGNSCQEYISKQGELLLDYQYLFLPIQYIIETEEMTKQLVPEYYLTKDKLEEKLDLIFEKELTIVNRETKKKYSLCEFLADPQMSNVGSFYSRGPRPRIKGGWSGSDDTEDNRKLLDIIQSKGLGKYKVNDSSKKVTPEQTIKEVQKMVEENFKRVMENLDAE